jgi:hypothetical protein
MNGQIGRKTAEINYLVQRGVEVRGILRCCGCQLSRHVAVTHLRPERVSNICCWSGFAKQREHS